MLHEAGFEIFREQNTVVGSIQDLEKIWPAKEFQSYRTEDLLVLGSWLAAKAVQ
jgi:hypothetical protein